jgi:crotonobetainyl-CoA:carnitine CoA-transferase CaiB-like acyl-CoA transferase
MRESHPDGTGLLAGLRVLDLTIWRPGPYATQLLAEIGADVVKIEPPGGDPMRAYPGLFAELNVNKRSIVLDLKDATDQRRALELAAGADVIIEGFRPGVADRLGVGYGDVVAVNPSAIYCSVSGMGQDGPLASVSGHDLNYQAWSGALAPDGGPPVVPALPIADLAGGMAAAFAVVAAVVRRLQTGEAERVDVSMTDVLATWTGATAPQARGVDPGARGVPGYGTFETRDGRQVALGVLTEDHFWQGLCGTLGLGEVAGLKFADRMGRLEELQDQIAGAVRRRGRDEVVADLLSAGVPVAPVLDRSEMVGLAHLRERKAITREPWQDPATGYPVSFKLHPATRRSPAPSLDEHRGTGFGSRPGQDAAAVDGSGEDASGEDESGEDAAATE